MAHNMNWILVGAKNVSSSVSIKQVDLCFASVRSWFEYGKLELV